MKALSVGKMTVTMHISDEQLFTIMAMSDKRYERKANKIITLPTPEEWNLYRKAVTGLRALEAYEGTDWGSPESEPSVDKPYPKHTYEYLETNDEWLARCRALRQETA